MGLFDLFKKKEEKKQKEPTSEELIKFAIAVIPKDVKKSKDSEYHGEVKNNRITIYGNFKKSLDDAEAKKEGYNVTGYGFQFKINGKKVSYNIHLKNTKGDLKKK